MELWTPDSARLFEEQKQAVDRQLSVARQFQRELHDFDPRMELVWAKEGSEEVGLVPGRWHLVRHNELGAPSFFLISGPDGEYREPDSNVLEELRAKDLRNERAVRDLEERWRQKREALARERERIRQERRDEMLERVESVDRVSIQVPR